MSKTSPNTESFEDQLEHQLIEFGVAVVEGRGNTFTGPERAAILAAHQATIDQRVAEAERLGRTRERYEILRYIESLGASELLTEIVNGIGKRGPTGDLGADYVPAQLTPARGVDIEPDIVNPAHDIEPEKTQPKSKPWVRHRCSDRCCGYGN